MPKIVIVEDDKDLNLTLAQQLSSLTKNVVSFFNLKSSLRFFEIHSAELVVIDRQLTDGDGLELIEYLNSSHFYTKTVILSRLGEVNDRIKGLSLGADEYLAKPFHSTELMLKVKKLLTKDKRPEANLRTYGPIKLNKDTGELKLHKKKLKLRKKEAQILDLLLRYKGRVVTHEQIIRQVWPNYEFIPTHTTINVYIRRLRMKFGPYKKAIETIRKFGYRLKLSELEK